MRISRAGLRGIALAAGAAVLAFGAQSVMISGATANAKTGQNTPVAGSLATPAPTVGPDDHGWG
jgi:hypothetical protein